MLPAKGDPQEQEAYQEKKLEPRLAEARAGERAVFFVDAAHFVFGAFLGYLGCFARCWIKAPSGRQRFSVLGALNAVTHDVITVTTLTYINSQSVCQLLVKLARLSLQVPITRVLDTARYQRCARVQSVANSHRVRYTYDPSFDWSKQLQVLAEDIQHFNGSSTTAFQKMGYNSLILNRFTLRDQFFSSDYSDSLVGDGVRKGDVGLLKQELA